MRPVDLECRKIETHRRADLLGKIVKHPNNPIATHSRDQLLILVVSVEQPVHCDPGTT